MFEELLLDADWSVNAGTWMWLSCSSFFQQFFHCYSPVRFGRKVDPEGDYIRSERRRAVSSSRVGVGLKSLREWSRLGHQIDSSEC